LTVNSLTAGDIAGSDHGVPSTDTGSAEATAKRVMIDIRGVTKRFGTGEGAVHALDDVSVAIRENEFFTLLGPSGCGKTTLLRLIAGFDHPTVGRIDLAGQDISQLPPFKRPVNTVFQSYALFPHMTVAQNIAFGLEMLGRPKADIADTVDRMLALVHMEAQKHRRTSEISGGQQQRVALARALAPRPKVLLLDEPLSALDLKLRKNMQIELKRLQHETGITFVFVTHDQEEALTMSDRIAVMSSGKILQVGSPRDIYDRPAVRFVADFIGETNFLEADVLSVDGTTAQIRLKAGPEVTAEVPTGFAPSGTVTAVVRPEQASLAPDPAAATLTGALETVVYFGTDTHHHLRLPSGETFTARIRTTRDGGDGLAPGGLVGIDFRPNAFQIVRD